jgi:4-diphosphocytidyl-2-C-methyl-D-erythritol kinase
MSARIGPERAPAKINLTLRVLGRRADGFHDLESLVAFAGEGDLVWLTPDAPLSLATHGETAAEAGPDDSNLILRAARALAERMPGLRTGSFTLYKRLPVAAGVGGGSSDAAAALRLLARANDLDFADPRLYEAAAATGSDVPVCLLPRARVFSGRGDEVSQPYGLQPLPAVIIHPGVALSTAAVFAALRLNPGDEGPSGNGPACFPATEEDLVEALQDEPNDLEPVARRLVPAIDTALGALRQQAGCRLARMSGSGASVYALFADRHAAVRAARNIRTDNPDWWVEATLLR